MRASWDETWLQVAVAMGRRSACTNRMVGAVIVDSGNRPISVGYNGAPAGFAGSSSCADFCPRSNSVNRGSSYSNCVSVHAEANALLFADKSLIRGGTVYVTNPCCWECAKLIANSGIKRVVVRKSAVDDHADVLTPIEFLNSCGLEVEVIEN